MYLAEFAQLRPCEIPIFVVLGVAQYSPLSKYVF